MNKYYISWCMYTEHKGLTDYSQTFDSEIDALEFFRINSKYDIFENLGYPEKIKGARK